MSAWMRWVSARWMSPLPERCAARAWMATQTSDVRALDWAAFFGLAARLHGGAAVRDDLVAGFTSALTTASIERVWRMHRGAVIALLEGWATALPAWQTEDGARARTAMLDLLVIEASWGRALGTGTSFRIGETLAFRVADALAATRDDQAVLERARRCARRFAADERSGQAWAQTSEGRWLDGAPIPTRVGVPREIDAVPFGALCAPEEASWRNDLSHRFEAQARDDVTMYDRAPLHVAAISAIVEGAGSRGALALQPLGLLSIEDLPVRLHAQLHGHEDDDV